MKTIFIITISVVSTLIVQGFLMYLASLNKKVKLLTNAISTFPTPEQMAKQVLKVKLPIADLPPELQKKALQNIETNKKNKTKDLPIQEAKDASYFG